VSSGTLNSTIAYYSRRIGRLRNDLYFVEWDVKLLVYHTNGSALLLPPCILWTESGDRPIFNCRQSSAYTRPPYCLSSCMGTYWVWEPTATLPSAGAGGARRFGTHGGRRGARAYCGSRL